MLLLLKPGRAFHEPLPRLLGYREPTQKCPVACTRSSYPEAFRASASQKARSSSSRVDAISCTRAQSSTP